MLSQHHLAIYRKVINNQDMTDTTYIRKQIADRHRARLAELIRAHFDDKPANFIRLTGINQGELSGLLNAKSFGPVKARKIESQAGLLPHSLEWDPGAPFLPGEAPHVAEKSHRPTQGHAEARVVGEAAQDLINAISEADRRGMSQDAFRALKEMVRLLSQPGQLPDGTADGDAPPR